MALPARRKIVACDDLNNPHGGCHVKLPRVFPTLGSLVSGCRIASHSNDLAFRQRFAILQVTRKGLANRKGSLARGTMYFWHPGIPLCPLFTAPGSGPDRQNLPNKSGRRTDRKQSRRRFQTFAGVGSGRLRISSRQAGSLLARHRLTGHGSRMMTHMPEAGMGPQCSYRAGSSARSCRGDLPNLREYSREN